MEKINFEHRVKELRDRKGWTDYRLAKEADMAYSTLLHLYKNVNLPTIPTLMKICEGLGITLAQFFTDDFVSLSEEQERYLKYWDSLDNRQKELVEAYIKGLMDGKE